MVVTRARWRRRPGENGPLGVELRDERKVVTVLFADLVGSTALGERLDPEELRLVVGTRSRGSSRRLSDWVVV